jgi:hypothetical protein
MVSPLNESSATSIAFKSHRDVPESEEGSIPIFTHLEKAPADSPQYDAASPRDTRRWLKLVRSDCVEFVLSLQDCVAAR